MLPNIHPRRFSGAASVFLLLDDQWMKSFSDKNRNHNDQNVLIDMWICLPVPFHNTVLFC
jgi:hypothetical protein